MKPLALFYLLVLYVILQFSWWAYLLIDLNREVYREHIEFAREHGHPEKVTGLEKELTQRWQMVAGEGIVFLGILIFGIYKTRQAFQKEFSLARQQKNFLLSVTHEFKSPLAAVKLNLQTLLRRELPREQQAAMLNRAVAEADRINNLIENALLAARIESHNYNLHKEEFSLTDCIESSVRNRLVPVDQNRQIITDIDPGIYMKGDGLAISSLILNLLENAEKYSPEGSPVTVTLKKDRKNAVLTVADLGIGIPDDEKSKIFNKFYRIGNEDTRNTKGTGLGLFIVKHIVGYHSGEIKVTDNHPTGTVFRVTLPLEPPSS